MYASLEHDLGSWRADYGDVNIWFSDAIENGFRQSKIFTSFAYCYPIYYIGFPFVAKIFRMDPIFVTAILLTLFKLAAIIIFRYILRENVLDNKNERLNNNVSLQKYVIDFAAIFSVIIWTIPNPLIDFAYYIKQIDLKNSFWPYDTGDIIAIGPSSPNVWHNGSLPVAVPFALLSILFFLRVFKALQLGKVDVKNLLGFAIFLFLSALGKPSVALVAIPAMGIMCFVTLIMSFKRRILSAIIILAAVIPTLILMLWQNSVISGNMLKLIFLVGGEYLHRAPLEIKFLLPIVYFVSAALFGALVFVFCGRKYLRNSLYLLSCLMVLTGYFIAFFFGFEKINEGEIATTSNTTWSYVFALDAFLVFSFIPLIKDTFAKAVGNVCGGAGKKIRFILLILVFCVHILAGLSYMYKYVYHGWSM
jgi:hypothetical protein